MNGSASPDPPTTEAGDSGRDEIAVATVNGHRSPVQNGDASGSGIKSSPPAHSPDVSKPSAGEDGPKTRAGTVGAPGDNEGGDSEAETLIESPVKKKEAEKQAVAQKADRPHKHRIGSLPVPTDNDDENDSAAVSPAPSTTAMSVEKTTSTEDMKDEEDMEQRDANSDRENDSDDALSSPRSHTSNSPSRASSVSRARSERPDRRHDGTTSPNPRKRKHRASSVSLPNKRPSIDAPKRRLRGLHSEGPTGRYEESLSPKLRAHRRTVSTQSVFADGTEGFGRKRKAATQGPGKESKLARGNWEESDGSSEATSHGHPEHRRLQKGIGRSTSTPGRPPGREHKRHRNKYGLTKLAEACENADMDQVKEWITKDPDQLEIAEFAGNNPLQIAAINGNVEVVDYLIERGCKIDCANVDKDTPLIDAAENGHLDVVNSLLRAGVDPLRQNSKGQQALDVVTDGVDDADAIRTTLRRAIEDWNSTGAKQKREEEEGSRYRGGPSKELHFMARSYENLLKLVQNNDRNGVREFLDARVPVDNTVIAAAAKTGDSYLVNMLLVELPEKKRNQKPEKPLLSVLGTSHFEMVQSLTELDNFNALYRNRSGKSWPELAEEKSGPNWRQEKELLQRLYDQRAAMKERRSSSPVTKRDSAKRRLISRTMEQESDEEEAPRRKNVGRKLMSRREMRARGQANSDASSDQSESEGAAGPEPIEESTMKPPQSPPLKRTPTRARTKSLSAQPPDNSSPRTRRRSSSLRGQPDQSLPTLEEKSEEKEVTRGKRAANDVAEAKKREAEFEAQAAARRAAEEDEAKAERERLAEEQLAAEKVRLAEMEQRRKEDEAKRIHRAHLVSSLPSRLSVALGGFPKSNMDSSKSSDDLIFRFTPLQVLIHEADAYWVANVQAAPLLGPQGIELLLQEDAPGYKGSLADTWEIKEVFRDDFPIIHSIIASLPQDPEDGRAPLDGSGKNTLPIDEQRSRTASSVNQAAGIKEALSGADIVIRYVRLEDVVKNLHTSLRGRPVEVKFDYLLLPVEDQDDKSSLSFPSAMASSMLKRPSAKTFVDGLETTVVRQSTGTTAVRIVNEK